MAHISKDSILKIKDKVDIVDFVSRYVDLKKQGNNYFGICPFHSEKTPSFSVNSSRQFYHCFGCGESGDVYTFAMSMDKIEFVDAIKKLVRLYNIKLDGSSLATGESAESVLRIDKKSLEYNVSSSYREDILSVLNSVQNIYREELGANLSFGAERARVYLMERGVSNYLIDSFGIGYAPSNDVFRMQLRNDLKLGNKDLTELLFRSGLIGDNGFRMFSNRITLPIKNIKGEVIGFNARLTNGRKDKKYINTGNRELFSKSNLLYGLDLIDKSEIESDGLFIVEGHFDIFGFISQGKKNCLGMGNSHLTNNNIDIIKALNPKRIFFVTDGDIPSVISSIKNADNVYDNNIVSKDDIKIIPTPDGKDPFDLFYSENANIGKYVLEHSLGVEEFMLSRKLRDFETTRINGLKHLRGISNHLFNEEEFRRISSVFLQNR